MCSKLSKVTQSFICYSLLLVSFSTLISVSHAQSGNDQAVSNQLPAGNVAELTEAFDNWMLRAYEGDRDAQFKVALMFSDGTGTEKDIEQAVYWYIQAARQGLASAQYNLGHKYLNGEGVKKDVNQAIKWWLKAAKQEHELAQFNVARAYYGGIGVDKNVEQARYWFRKAAANNEPRSEKILVSIFQEDPGSIPVATTPNTTEVASTQKQATDDSSKQTNGTSSGTSVIQQATTTIADKTRNSIELKADNSIAVYNRPDKNSMLVSIIPAEANISVVKTTNDWVQVSVADGFPVWVYKNFVKTDGVMATVTGDNVNARAVPLVLRGSVVGQLFKGAELKVLETQDKWVRLQSQADFTAWVERTELDQALAAQSTETTSTVESTAIVTEEDPTQDDNVVDATATAQAEKAPISAEIQQTENSNENYAFKNARNDNDWLFGLPDNSFTIQLASFSADSELNKFLKNQSLVNDPAVKQFISNRNDIEWKYLLYGNYSERDLAERVKSEKRFKNAWIRNVNQIRKNRCVAWKTILPTPTELKTYCQK